MYFFNVKCRSKFTPLRPKFLAKITLYMNSNFPLLRFTAAECFLRYVIIDTQSDPSSDTFPSTEKQKNLGRLVAGELKEIGIQDAHMDEYGYVYATIPANTDKL